MTGGVSSYSYGKTVTTDLRPKPACMTWPCRTVKHVNMTHSDVCLFCPLRVLSVTEGIFNKKKKN